MRQNNYLGALRKPLGSTFISYLIIIHKINREKLDMQIKKVY